MADKVKKVDTESNIDIENAVDEVLTEEEAVRIEKVFFEDDEEVMLRDGKVYKIHPCTLKDARKLMKLLRTVNIEAIILNLLPSEDGEEATSEGDLFDVLLLAFKGYPHVDRNYIDNYVDLELARQIIDIMIGINGIKKSIAQ